MVEIIYKYRTEDWDNLHRHNWKLGITYSPQGKQAGITYADPTGNFELLKGTQ